MTETMGQRIKRLRTQKGWRQVDLEHASGLAHNQLSDLENDRRPNPQQRTVERVATALEVSTIYLRDGVEHAGTEATADYPAWARGAPELSPKVSRIVLKIIDDLKDEEADGE